MMLQPILTPAPAHTGGLNITTLLLAGVSRFFIGNLVDTRPVIQCRRSNVQTVPLILAET
jgi:hypothetical protein